MSVRLEACSTASQDDGKERGEKDIRRDDHAQCRVHHPLCPGLYECTVSDKHQQWTNNIPKRRFRR